MLARRTLPGLAVAAGVTLMTLAFASPALAADVEVRINAPSSITIGRTDDISGSVQNNGKETFFAVQRVITIRLDGLSPEGVQVSLPRGGDLPKESSGGGEVRFVDPVQLPLGSEGRRDTITSRYLIRFTEVAPPGDGRITLEAFAADQSLGSDTDEFTVRAPRGSQPSPTKPVHTDPAPTGGIVASPSNLAPIDGDIAGASSDSGGVPVIFYVLGGVLVLAGGAILWLLFHGPRGALVDSNYADGPDYQGPVPRHAQFDGHPTAVLPTVRSPYTSPAGGGPGADPTRDLRGNPGRPR